MDIATEWNTDPALGQWMIKRASPADLADLIDVIWYFEGTTPHRRERVFPSGLVEFHINLGEPYRLVTEAGKESVPAVYLEGIRATPRILEAPPGVIRVLGVRLHPAGASAMLPFPLGEISGIKVDLDQLTRSSLLDRCRDLPTADDRIRFIARWLRQRFARTSFIDRRIIWVASEIRCQEGQVRISDLCRETGLSKARLATMFHQQIGVLPKLYARIVRFRHTLGALHLGEEQLVDLAYKAGYYDQPHMNGEFREMSGLAPTEYLTSVRYHGRGTIAEPSS